MSAELPADDLDHVVEQVGSAWDDLRGARVLVTGASGFFGSWMLESLLHAATKRGFPVRAVALTRSAHRFSQNLPRLAGDPRVEILQADAASMPAPEGPVDVMIHSLVPDAGTDLADMNQFFQNATGRLLEIAELKRTRNFLLCSTGAVYQPKVPPAPFSETDELVPLEGPLSYGQIRRRVEEACLAAGSASGLPVKIARGFTFVGPRLPLDGPFAIGNFLRDALRGGPIVVKGDGSPVRSYLYAADMAAWLWTILLRGRPGCVINVGGKQPVRIDELASIIARLFGVRWHTEGKAAAGAAPDLYVPQVGRACAELGLRPWTTLPEAIKKMQRLI